MDDEDGNEIQLGFDESGSAFVSNIEIEFEEAGDTELYIYTRTREGSVVPWLQWGGTLPKDSAAKLKKAINEILKEISAIKTR